MIVEVAASQTILNFLCHSMTVTPLRRRRSLPGSSDNDASGSGFFSEPSHSADSGHFCDVFAAVRDRSAVVT